MVSAPAVAPDATGSWTVSPAAMPWNTAKTDAGGSDGATASPAGPTLAAKDDARCDGRAALDDTMPCDK